jgi:hypothetical protein
MQQLAATELLKKSTLKGQCRDWWFFFCILCNFELFLSKWKLCHTLFQANLEKVFFFDILRFTMFF